MRISTSKPFSELGGLSKEEKLTDYCVWNVVLLLSIIRVPWIVS